MEYIQGEKFIGLANDVDIFYCHTHDVNTFFSSQADSNWWFQFVLISHNSDGCITNNPQRKEDADSRLMPSNLLLWYGQNVCVKDSKIKSLPIGIENNKWLAQARKKEKMIVKLLQPKRIKKLVYINHSISTNPGERQELYQMLESERWVTTVYGRNGYRFDEYVDNIYNHRFVVCPEGNGIDTHRIWETLYLRTIPIVKRSINNQFYTDLPICFVDDWKEVTEEFLNTEYARIKGSVWDMGKLDFAYWKNKIQVDLCFSNFTNLMQKEGSEWGTHQMVLLEILKRVNKPVLELGAGGFSTVQIHVALKDRGVKILTVESNKKWLNKYKHLKTDLHALNYVRDVEKFYADDNEQWGLVFIDNSGSNSKQPWNERKSAILKYSKIADYIVLHDCDAILIDDNRFGQEIKPIDPAVHDPGIRDYSKTFKYWIEFFVDGWKKGHPPVLLASNKICLDDITGIDSMIISNRNAK